MKFLIADDHELFLQGMEFILHQEYPQTEIVTAKNYTDIFEILAQRSDFDLILTDLAMPGYDWLDAIAKIHQICPDIPIIIISAVFEREILQKTYNLGVSGYVSKAFPKNLIIGAINLVLAGGIYIPPELLQTGLKSSSEQVRQMVKDLSTPADSKANSYNITPRQKEVLSCMAEGLQNKQIAYNLGLSEGTVKIHITQLMRTLGVSNRTAAVRKAVECGLLKVSD